MNSKGVLQTSLKDKKGWAIKKEEPKFHRIKVKIDSLLAKDIALINNNMLPHSQPRQLEISKHSQLVEEYISNNYQEYGVPDPMPRLTRIHRHQRHFTSFQDKKYRRIDLFQPQHFLDSESGQKEDFVGSEGKKKVFKTEPDQIQGKYFSTKKRSFTQELSDKRDQTKKRVIKLKQPSNKIECKFLSTEQKSIKNPSQIRGLSEEPSFHFSALQFHESRLVVNEKSEGKQSEQKSDLSGGPISELFRYCIGCQKAVLEANIPYHEAVCSEFQSIMILDWEGISKILDQKIVHLQQSIRVLMNNTFPSSDQNKNKCLKLLEESENHRKGCETSTFYKLNCQLKECFQTSNNLLEALSKLRWFMKIEETAKLQIKK